MRVVDKFIFMFLLISCQETEYTNRQCDQLARHTYKGLPKAASKFKKYCTNKNLQWSPEKCKEVFQKVILKTSRKKLEEEYGEEYLECLSENDIEKFGSYLLENK